MSNLRILRQRMKSISSIGKVTAAMKLISTVTLRRHQQKFEAASQYHHALLNTVQVLAHNIEEKPLLLGDQKKQDKPAIIAIFSDKGLCGSYNHLVASRTNYLIHHREDAQLFVLGHKGLGLLSTHTGRIKAHYNIKEAGAYGPIQALAQQLVCDFYAGTINSCIVVYTQFKSILSTVPAEKTIFPMDIDPASNPLLLYGTDPEGREALQAAAEQYVAAQLYYLVQQSIVSENAVRMFAMDNATKNADDMLQSLNKVYHKTRQQNITQEIMEIIGGSEAL